MFGTRYIVAVDGKKKKFRELEKATDYRNEQLERRKSEQEAAAREVEAAARVEYDRNPEYIAIEVRPPLHTVKEPDDHSFLSFNRDKDDSFMYPISEHGVAKVDVEAYTREINDACYELWRRGYEIVSITPLISGHAGFKSIIKGPGWGYSYTEGVVLLARRLSEQVVGYQI